MLLFQVDVRLGNSLKDNLFHRFEFIIIDVAVVFHILTIK
jgi:hypothetical protein